MFRDRLLGVAYWLPLALLSLGGASSEAAPTRHPAHLIEIQQRGYLRVGTTGDYPPFSALNTATQGYEGRDIEAAQSLGASLRVEVRFVPTSWPHLMEDLAADRFDIGMGGITITPERLKVALFSVPYLQDGKVALVRCAERQQFSTLAEINRPTVRLLENPGGTNEAFARKHARQAQLILHPQNPELFQELLDSHADVMITDSTEALRQEKEHPGLCAINPTHPLQVEEKGYLLPQGDVGFQHRVNHWLRKRLQQKTPVRPAWKD